MMDLEFDTREPVKYCAFCGGNKYPQEIEGQVRYVCEVCGDITHETRNPAR